MVDLAFLNLGWYSPIIFSEYGFGLFSSTVNLLHAGVFLPLLIFVAVLCKV